LFLSNFSRAMEGKNRGVGFWVGNEDQELP
jgi:hypothetical protein